MEGVPRPETHPPPGPRPQQKRQDGPGVRGGQRAIDHVEDFIRDAQDVLDPRSGVRVDGGGRHVELDVGVEAGAVGVPGVDEGEPLHAPEGGHRPSLAQDVLHCYRHRLRTTRGQSSNIV